MPHDVVTIGSAVQDVFLLSKAFQVIASAQFETGQGECVALGTKVPVEEYILASGGGATNAAATFARLGFSTATICKVGHDTQGQSLVDDLAAHGIDTSLIKTDKKGKTGLSTLLTTSSGERSALVFRGVSADLTAADVPFKTLKPRALYVTSLAGNVSLLSKIVDHARKNKIFLAINPGAGELKDGRDLLRLLSGVQLISLNREEAQTVLGSQQRDVVMLAKDLAERTKTTVIITDGPHGAYAAQGKKAWFSRTRTITSLSSTGAGDAFGSGVVAALLKGLSLEDALRVGTLNAESVIQKYGAKAGILKTWPSKKLLAEISVREVR